MGVKRMTPSENAKGRRENKTYTFDVNVSDELDLGLNLKGIKSGLGEKSSDSFLYVKDLREYPNGDPGPGLVAGVRPYDLLLRINGVEIDAISDVKRAIKGKKTVQCEVRRMIRQLTVGRHRKLSLDDPLSDSGVHEETLVVTRTGGESLGLSLSEAYGGGSDT